MTRSRYILAALPLAAAAASAQKGATPLPNVILLVADDLGYGDLSCYGATRVLTPNVDQLARDGVLFTDVHACASTSTPSRYGLLTGEYPFRREGTDVAAGNAGMIIKPTQYTMADMFRAAGYRTAAVGKWHLGLGSTTAAQDWNGLLDEHLADLGFDYSYIMAATADRVPCVFIENGRVANYDPSAPIEVSYRQNFDGEPTGRTHPHLLTKLRSSHGHDQSIVNGIGRIGYMRGGGKALWQDENLADSILAHAVTFIRDGKGQGAGTPFFLYLSTNDVHVPRYPHERFRGKSAMGLRGDAILQFDWTLGELRRALRELGLEDNTLIVLTSDNGPVLDDGYKDDALRLAGTHRAGGPFRGAKYSAYEAGSAVPFIVSWPARAATGHKSDALLSLNDLFRSFSALIGQSLPETAAPDSRDVLPTLLGRSHKSVPYVLTMPNNRSVNLRTKRWKYIEPSSGKPMIGWGPRIETGYKPVPQLYDMTQSRYEAADVAQQHPELVEKFQGIINSERARNISGDRQKKNSKH